MYMSERARTSLSTILESLASIEKGHYKKKNILRVIHHDLLDSLPHNYLNQTIILQITPKFKLESETGSLDYTQRVLQY